MIYAFGQYELDTRVYELRHAGVVRAVEPQVFNVLAFLVQNRDRVVSKDELLEKLWSDRFVSDTTLVSRLKEARKAVGDTGEKQLVIRTQRGRGYRFIADVVEQGDHAPTIVASRDVTANRTGFVGRHVELQRLTSILGRALGGSRQIVFVTGEAGVGKTALVDAFLAKVTVEGALIARGQCVEYRGSGEPYMPLLDAFARLCRGSSCDCDRLMPLLRSEAPSWLVQMPSVAAGEELAHIRAGGTGGERMLRELGMMIDRLTAEIPLILLLEDLHWSDYATLDAIDLLAKQSGPARLMIIGTWRPSDVKAVRHPVNALSQELRVRGQCEVIHLPLLDTGEIDSYLRIRFGDASFSARLAPILHSRTAGNALFVRNLVDSWVERGLLGADPEQLERDVPDSLQQLIESQVADLDPEQQRILAAASVVGRAFPVALLAATLPAADEDVERECERLVRESNIIRSEGTEQWGDGALTSRFSFVHDLHVDVLYLRIPAARRARLHQQVGLALERAFEGRQKERASEMALHFRRALDRERGPKYLLLAAERAVERSAYREAVEHLTAALALLEEAPQTNERNAIELEIRIRLAPALVATRGWADSGVEEHYLRARDLAESLGDSTSVLKTLLGLATMYEFRGEYEIAERMAQERIVLPTILTRDQTLESQEILTCSFMHQGRFHDSVRHGEEALAAFDESEMKDLSPEPLVRVVQTHGWMSGGLHFTGRVDEALSHSDRAVALATEHGNEYARASAHVQAGFLHFYRREADVCHEHARMAESIGREFRFPFHVACSRILMGWADPSLDAAEAVKEIRAGMRTAEAIGARMDMPLFHAIVADVFIRSGQLDAALQELDQGIALLHEGRTFFYAPELYRVRGEMLAPSSRDEALREIERALELAEQNDSSILALRAARNLSVMDGGRWKKKLRAISDGFRQGLDSVDLREARAILA